MKDNSKIIEKLLNESIESRIEEIAKKIGEIEEVDNVDLEVGSEYEYKKSDDSPAKVFTFLKRGKKSSHGPFYFLDRNGNEIMLGEKQVRQMKKKETFNLSEMIHSELEEKLHGNQTKIDKNKNGKIDAEDFKLLRKGKKSEMEEDLGGMDDGHPELGDTNFGELTDKDKKGKFAKYYNPLSLKDNKKEDEEDFGTKRSRFFDMEDQEDEWEEKMGNIEESDKKFIQRATEKMEKKGSSGKFGAWCKKEGLDKDGEVTKKCIDKAMKSDDSKVVKMANFAKNIGGFKGAKHESIEYSEVIYDITFGNENVSLTENEMVDLIEEIVKEQKSTTPGIVKQNQISKKDGDINRKANRESEKKMAEYVNPGSKGKFDMNPTSFPKGNGELGEMSKNAYRASDAVEEYIENFAYSPGMENLSPDEIGYNDKKVDDYIKGSAKNGNSPKYANAVETELGEKIVKKRKENLYKKEKDRSYNRVKQPVDVAGHDKKSGKLDDMFKGLGESVENEKETLLTEDMDKIKKLINY